MSEKPLPKPQKTFNNLRVALVTATFSIFASLMAVTLQNYFTTKAAQDETLRVQRRDTYKNYTNSYNDYSYKTEDFKKCLMDEANRTNLDLKKSENYSKLATIGYLNCSGPAYVHSRFEYQDAVNMVYQDGSSQAIKLIKTLASFMPTSVGQSTDEFGLPPISEIIKYENNQKLEVDIFHDLLDQICYDTRPAEKEICYDF